MQEEILATELIEAQGSIMKWANNFEKIYCERDQDRLNFVRPSMHAPLHLGHGTQWVGPVAIYAQWTMERLIGNLGREIGQHSDPYENLAQRAVRRCQINALKISNPSIEETPKTPKSAFALGDGYA